MRSRSASAPRENGLGAALDPPIVLQLPHRGLHAATKRAIDVVGAAVILSATAPLSAVAAAAIAVTRGGPVVVREERVGRDGIGYVQFGFRSTGVRPVPSTNRRPLTDVSRLLEPKPTLVGRVVRRWRVDHLPELVNVLKGDMSLVGPRAWRPDLAAGLTRAQRQRELVRPGWTGTWLAGWAEGLPAEDLLALDLAYVHRHTISGDLRILLATPRLALRRR